MRARPLALLLGAFGVPLLAQGRPQPTLRPVVTLPGIEVYDVAMMPNGRVLYFVSHDSLFAHDIAAKRSTLVSTGEFDDISVSSRGNRIVFDRENEAGTMRHIWSMPVDSATGRAAGAPQRVSTREGHEGRIAPDGRNIAFISPLDSSPDLVVVPVTGGPERVLATFPAGLGSVEWSPDGVSLLTAPRATRTTGSDVTRVTLATGATERMHSVAAAVGSWAVYDGAKTVFRGQRQSANEYSIREPNGVVTTFTLPEGTWSRIDPVRGAVRRYVVAETSPRRTFQVSVADGRIRPVLSTANADLATGSPAEQSVAAAISGEQSVPGGISPDGRLLAVRTTIDGKSGVRVIDLSTSRARTFSLPHQLQAIISDARWAPDSRRLAFWADQGTKLVSLDVTTGATAVLFTSAQIGLTLTWTSDGSRLRFSQLEADGSRAVYEVGSTGPARKLRDLPTDARRRGMFITPDLIEYGTGQHEFVVRVSGGAPRQLPVTSPPLNGVPSRFGSWWIFLLATEQGSGGRIQVVNAAGDTTKVIDLPFEAIRSPIPLSAFGPGHREVYVVGRAIGETAQRLYAVPVDGRPPREIAVLSTDPAAGVVNHLDISPDGRTIIYTVVGRPTTTVYEHDMRPVGGRTPGGY